MKRIIIGKMKINTILLDLDNTLYNYDFAHKKSMNKVEDYCLREFNISRDIFQDDFKKARKLIHINLGNTGASHNRVLYFQKLLELLNVNSLEYSLDLYNIYWETFLDSITLIDDVEKTLKYWKSKNTTLCVLTDLTAHIQFRKIKKLGLEKYIDVMVTSEEVGHEKPHSLMFFTALDKTKSSKEEVFMIGDNWDKDILGAMNFGIKSIWFNQNQNEKREAVSKIVYEAKTFKEIRKLIG